MSSKTGKLWVVSYTNWSLPNKFKIHDPPEDVAFGPDPKHTTDHIQWRVEHQADWSERSQNMIIRLKPAEVDDLLTWAGLREEVTHGDASQ